MPDPSSPKRLPLRIILIALAVLITFYSCSRNHLIRDAAITKARKESVGRYEDGLWVKGRKTTAVPLRRQPNRIAPQPNGSIRAEINCEEDLRLASLEPGESIEIRHVQKLLERQNRCSYSATGDSISLSEAARSVTLPRFKNDLPFPNLPGTVVFYLKDPNTPLAYRSIRQNKKRLAYVSREGGLVTLTNATNHVQEVRLVYNYPLEFLHKNGQIGWDGSTITFIAEKIPPKRPHS